MSKPPAERDPLVHLATFQKAVIDWFRREQHPYPWRETPDPYAILVSEIMLQQTTVAAVLARGYFTRFLERFPTLQDLARAEEADVLSQWEGLGYYSRARNLQKAAQAIVANHNGVFPNDPKDIRALPGVGPYTAGAVSSFAFDLAEPIVDGNIARVLSRVFDYDEPIDSSRGQKQLWDWAGECVSPSEPRLFNGGLMEIGQRLCTKTKPSCLLCPIHSFCHCSDPETLPKKKPRQKITELDEHVIFCRDSAGAVLLQQEQGRRRAGLWKLPERDNLEDIPPIHTLTYVITRYRVQLHVYEVKATAARPLQDNEAFIGQSDLATTPMPSPYRKALNTLLES